MIYSWSGSRTLRTEPLVVDEMRFGVHWKSRKGSARERNRDAAAVLLLEHATLAIIVDGAEIEGRACEFGGRFAREVADLVASQKDVDIGSVMAAMREIHFALRRQYIPERFCFAALLIRSDLNVAWMIGLGDCRIGKGAQTGYVEWVSPVHSLACAPAVTFDTQHAFDPVRHIVTRIVGVRFDPPGIVKIDGVSGTSWTLATDGYWVSTLTLEEPPFPGEDDTSVLWLSQSATEDVCDSDHPNLYVRRG
jgi:hypothetical protein